MAYFLGRYRINRIRRARDKLEKTVAERTREIQKMNEEIAAQNEELVSQSESIYAQNQELSNQKEALQKMKNTLELEVDKRTFELKKLNTELIDQNSKLEQFTFITAHNLKAPIAQLKGLLSLIPDNLYQDQMNREVMKRLKHSAVHLDEVVSDLNNILNIKRSATEISEKVSLDNQLNKTLRALSEEFKENEITVYKSVAEGLFIRGVKAYVQSIFYNLLHNAIKYASKERDSFVKINMKRVGDQIVIKISDNGIGIDMKYAHDKIFQLYQRFNTEYQGKGFGLFLVKSQIEVMDGKIEVSSELHKGTSFTIIFPAYSN
jgi:signal transduction histidine kinase